MLFPNRGGGTALGANPESRSSHFDADDPYESLETTVSDGALEDVEADFAPLAGTADQRDALRDLDPFQHDSLQAQEAFDAAVAAAQLGSEEAAVQYFLRASKLAETAREWYLSALACQRVGDYLLGPQPPYDPERAFRMYRRAIAAYEQCGLFAEARDLAYRQMCLRLQKAKDLGIPLGQRVELWLYWLFAGFGYRPGRVLSAALVVVLTFGVIFWATNGVVGPGVGGRVDLFHAIYFSGITFATIGYGDYLPAPHMQFLALAEGALGVMMMGFFVAVLANRISKA